MTLYKYPCRQICPIKFIFPILVFFPQRTLDNSLHTRGFEACRRSQISPMSYIGQIVGIILDTLGFITLLGFKEDAVASTKNVELNKSQNIELELPCIKCSGKTNHKDNHAPRNRKRER